MTKRKVMIPQRPSAAPDPDKRPRERRTLHVRFGGTGEGGEGSAPQ